MRLRKGAARWPCILLVSAVIALASGWYATPGLAGDSPVVTAQNASFILQDPIAPAAATEASHPDSSAADMHGGVGLQDISSRFGPGDFALPEEASISQLSDIDPANRVKPNSAENLLVRDVDRSVVRLSSSIPGSPGLADTSAEDPESEAPFGKIPNAHLLAGWALLFLLFALSVKLLPQTRA